MAETLLQYTAFALLVLLAWAALNVRDLLAAVFLLSGYSFLTALLMTHMGAVDVGFTEASVGAGLTGVFFLMAIARTSRRSGD
jgi:multicomponent Na+:H+ antiporter subunit B